MSITRQEMEDFGMPPTTALARLITGRTKGEVFEDEPKETKKSLTVRLDPALHAKIEEYRKKAKISKTAVVEILLWSGITTTEKQIELDGQLDLEGVDE